jgi:quercetin dioxygenase-like cupin family protein
VASITTSHPTDHPKEYQMKITPSSADTGKGPADRFTGDVYIDGIRDPDDQSDVSCAHVRFTPGARTAWHHHPKGQTLYVTDGIGYVARRGGQPQEIRPGDVVHIEPGEEHWHGATAGRFMAHVAIHAADEHGEVATWLEHVSDQEYAGRSHMTPTAR